MLNELITELVFKKIQGILKGLTMSSWAILLPG